MISIVIPAFNESENIERFPNELMPFLQLLPEEFELIIVNDGSTDNTLEISKTIQNNYNNVTIISHPCNLGLGQAIRTGIANANGNLILTMDADLTFSPKDIISLYETQVKTDADCVIGSHFIHPNGFSGVAFHRIILSRTVNYMYKFILRKPITAISSIFRLYKKTALSPLSLTSTGFTINAEILFNLLQQNYVIVEVPVQLTTRKFGIPKLKTSDEIKNHLLMLWQVIKWRLKNYFTITL